MTTYSESRLHASDGLSLHVHCWTPDTGGARLRAVVAIIHGMGEHGGRYARLAEHFAAQGLATVTYDLRGHGRSGGARVFVKHFDEYLDDTEIFLTHVRTQFGPAPLFLLGHSMGGAIAALYTITRAPANVRALMLSSPALAPGEPVAPWMVKAGRWVSRWLPKVPVFKIDPAMIARDKAVVAAAKQDPLNAYRGTPARTAAELLDAMARIHANADALRLPLYVFHGTADRLTAPWASEQFHGNAGSQDKTLRLYPGHFHETLNDLDREKVIDELTQWLMQHLPETPVAQPTQPTVGAHDSV
ncbi:Monoacylglycerol lipase [Pandoraea cepalis]|uniref:Monoacylglycerol lipase n=1 Tax=Pandoraea cepalis TaxID=2508294 RepID=A0A5E4UBX5_9BURK|nr:MULTISPECIES: alpha/beta hydrolase [Pandoraea]BDD90788.1 hydrolase [Pandoraea sp. NE5]VVD97520.1 Monoacylglycerol lipase [Pandoraea cepalis]